MNTGVPGDEIFWGNAEVLGEIGAKLVNLGGFWRWEGWEEWGFWEG